MQQRTEEWFKARCGKVTASRLGDVMGKTKSGGYTASRENYKKELICQRLTGQYEDVFVSKEMKRGTELEPEAREMYRWYAGLSEIKEVGFIAHPSLLFFGASPDGLVNQEGMIEIKCPKASTHWETFKTHEIKPDYVLQMQAQMMCTGRQWCDFVSYDNRFPLNLAYFSTRVYFDPVLAEKIEKEVRIFLNEVEKEIQSTEEKADEMWTKLGLSPPIYLMSHSSTALSTKQASNF